MFLANFQRWWPSSKKNLFESILFDELSITTFGSKAITIGSKLFTWASKEISFSKIVSSCNFTKSEEFVEMVGDVYSPFSGCKRGGTTILAYE